jgi:glycosyltransferase involved in cell wall biosynthesis
MTGRLLIYHISKPSDRWFNGDHKWRAKVRRVIRGPDKIGGVEQVFLNLIGGLRQLGADVGVNVPFSEIQPRDHVGIIGVGPQALEGYTSKNPILAGVAVAEHPRAWPTLFEEYPVARYVVHCDWVRSIYERHYGPRIVNWAVGIDTERWSLLPPREKQIDILIYDKVRWDYERVHSALAVPIRAALDRRKLSYEFIRYGQHDQSEFRTALARARAMLFLCEHESQGLAYQEAMSSGVPILAWNPGRWLDPWRYRYGEDAVPATTVPFFDERCGRTFASAVDFEEELDVFMDALRAGAYAPRDYVCENLTLAGCAQNYANILHEINA